MWVGKREGSKHEGTGVDECGVALGPPSSVSGPSCCRRIFLPLMTPSACSLWVDFTLQRWNRSELPSRRGPRARHCSLLLPWAWTKTKPNSVLGGRSPVQQQSPFRAVSWACVSRATTGTGTDKSLELIPVPCLHVYGPGASEAAHQALARLEAAHGSAARLLNPVVAAPSNKMTIVDDVLLAGLKLCKSKQKEAGQRRGAQLDLRRAGPPRRNS